jgi:hypothetical protein
VTSRISRSAGAQSFGGAHRGRVCVHVFVGVSVVGCECLALYCVKCKKKNCFTLHAGLSARRLRLRFPALVLHASPRPPSLSHFPFPPSPSRHLTTTSPAQFSSLLGASPLTPPPPPRDPIASPSPRPDPSHDSSRSATTTTTRRRRRAGEA